MSPIPSKRNHRITNSNAQFLKSTDNFKKELFYINEEQKELEYINYKYHKPMQQSFDDQ